jgi:di/tricarboxylate transporter
MIGTSTNMLVNGLWINSGRESFSLFDITWIGLPVAVVGLGYLVIASRKLLPDRRPAMSQFEDARQYTVEMVVEPGSGLVGQTIEQAGLRGLPGMYLMEIDREGQLLPAVSHAERLRANDRLVFVGVVESVIDLQKFRGLKPATNQVFKLNAPRTYRALVEAVVSNSCPLVGKSIREGRFRSVYNAAVIAVSRNGERVGGKIGDIVLRPGDTLLLETRHDFAEQQRNSRDFFLVSNVDGGTPPRHDKAMIALAILVGMVLFAGFELLTMLNAAMLAAGLMVITRCCTAAEARRSVDWQVLLTIGASLGIGKALQTSGAAMYLANSFLGAAGHNRWLVVATVYGVTLLFTELMSNNTAAAIVFPLAMAASKSFGDAAAVPFAMTVMIAASCGFATPLGYQTHMMVYGPGGYRFSDFVRIGLPLDVLCGVVTVALVPLIWPF